MLVGSGLFKKYGDRTVVHDVDVSLRPGRIVGLVGANGAGKTTTIKMLCGLVEPTQGTAQLDGTPTLKADVRRRIGYLPEESPLYDDESALSYLRFFGGLYDMSRSDIKTRGDQLLRRLRLGEDHWKKPIGDLSRGMRRKVAIARCLLHDPDVLLLDETTSGLDPFTSKEVEDFIVELRAQGKALLLSAHNLAQVEALCDEIVLMHEGKVVARGTLAELQQRWGERAYRVRGSVAFPGSAPDAGSHLAVVDGQVSVETCIDAIRRARGSVLEVAAITPRLDEILEKASGG